MAPTLLRSVLGLLTLSLAACEITTSSGPPANRAPGYGYGPQPPGPPPPGPQAAPPQGAPPQGAPPPAAGGCPQGSYCFNVIPKAPGPIGPSRLVLMWTPPSDDAKVPPEIVPLANLSGQERTVVVPASAIRPPKTTLMLGQAWGYVFASPPSSPPSPKQAVGVAYMMFVHAAGGQPQGGYMKEKFPAGIAPGTAPYFMQKGAGSHDNLVLAPPGSVFELGMCPTTSPGCDLPSPNPS